MPSFDAPAATLAWADLIELRSPPLQPRRPVSLRAEALVRSA
jgi:hypothetical protein